jgi:outer membrane receptor protein involved in Fe transport
MDDLGGSVANVSSLVNGGTGKIYGVELSGQYSFSNGLGFAANYTKSNSESSQNNTFDKNVPIPGVSKDAVNLTAYFERAGFSARAAYSWRSEAVNSSGVGSSFSFNGADGTPQVYTIYSAKYGQLDGQLGYDFGAHSGILLSAINLTNAKQHTYLQ